MMDEGPFGGIFSNIDVPNLLENVVTNVAGQIPVIGPIISGLFEQLDLGNNPNFNQFQKQLPSQVREKNPFFSTLGRMQQTQTKIQNSPIVKNRQKQLHSTNQSLGNFVKNLDPSIAQKIEQSPLVRQIVQQPSGGSMSDNKNINSDINSLIQKTAEQFDLSPDFLMKMAKIESNFNPKAVSPTGASGLFQFTRGTWNDMRKNYGDQYDVDWDNRFDPEANSTAAALLAKRNARALQNRIGREPTPAELYMAHNIGAGGASRLLSADPNATVDQVFQGNLSGLYRHNPMFFMDKGKPISAQDAISRYNSHFEGI